MNISNDAKIKGLESIHKTMDSNYGQEIHLLLKNRTPENIIFNIILRINLITFLALLIAYFGLGLMAVSAYVACAYSLILITSLQQFFSYRKRNPVNVSWYHGVLEDAAIWLLLIVNGYSVEAANPVIALSLVFALLFVLASLSFKPYGEYVASNIIFLGVCVYFALFWGDEITASAQVLFPLTISFVLLFSVGYWHYIRQVKMLHLTLSEKHLQKALEDRNQELINEHRIRDKMIRHIGHDLRQPINSAALSVFNLKSSVVRQDQGQQLAMACRSLESANCLIEDIVQIASYKKQGAIDVVKEACIIGDLLQTVVREYTFAAEQADCNIKVISSSIQIYSDPIIVSRILRNFLSNAVRHAKGAKILVGVRRKTESIIVQVLDNGPGMSAELLSNAFGEFVQGHSSEKATGFGLGLNIAQTLAQAIDAKVAIQSLPGKGTVCSLYLPLPNY
jgi:signal transduction histidine kinase